MGEKLTFEQQLAVDNRGGKILVSAAAGSGKTKVLVDRLLSYILDSKNPANIDDFLMITYTKAAASELRGKIASKLSEYVSMYPNNKHLRQQLQRLYLAKISTVHGFCGDILRQYAYCLDISSDFRVAEESECLQLQIKALEQVVSDAYEADTMDADFRAFVDTQGIGRDDRQIPEIVLKVYNSARCHLEPKKWLQWCCSSDISNETDAGATPWGQYLISDLQEFVSLQIDALQRCILAAKKADGLEKQTALFESVVQQLKNLNQCKSWDDIRDNQNIDYGRLVFSKNITDIQLAEQMKAVRNACKEGLAKRLRSFTDCSATILEDLAGSVSAARGLVGLVNKFAEQYDCLKRTRGILDFGDLEHKALDLLLGRQRLGVTAAASEIADRFREVLVDEYQDSNEIQDAIFRALTIKRHNCFMVGDVKQSIYQFRLADPSIFIEKYNTYDPAQSAVDGQGRKVLLSQNFRSSAGIISAVNDVFSTCMSDQVGGLSYGEMEALREGIPHIPLNEPEVELYGIDVNEDTYAEEASFVANRIAALLDGTHYIREKDTLRCIRPEDIVILLRSPGSVGGEFQHALQTKGIRCKTGDATSLWNTDEIATVRAILRIIYNPIQDIPLVSVLTSPVFGFTSNDLALLRSTDVHADMYTVLRNAKDNKSTRFVSMLAALRKTAQNCSVTELLSDIYSQTKLLCAYSAMVDGDIRLANLHTFFKIVSDFENTGPKDLSRLLDFLDAAEQKGLAGSGADQGGDGVTIMSVHKSKGLEFPVVFLCGLSRVFNMESVYGQVLCDKELGFGLGCFDSQLRVRYPSLAKLAISRKIMRESISEELRVLYVAMTRARDRLIMTYAGRNLQKRLEKIATRLDMCDAKLLSMEADCPGAWVLQTALRRTEAGAFFQLGSQPCCTSVSEIPWSIQVVDGCIESVGVLHDIQTIRNEISEKDLDDLADTLSFRYSNIGATRAPSKLTATQLKGRLLDVEISEGTPQKQSPIFRNPDLDSKRTGTEYGNAIHTVMQYIDFTACNNVNTIDQDLQRMVHEQLITQDQAASVNCETLLNFFSTPTGVKLKNSNCVLREFKFSLLDDATKYYPDVSNEYILLQGVVDCAIIDDDGIVILDFKTDRVTEDTIADAVEKYKSQVEAYANALHRIYKLPIKSSMLYFFELNRFVDVI